MEKRPEAIKRVADANLNRAREGLRVVEDIARFVLDNEQLTNFAKNMRSEISILQKKHKDFISLRETESDVGVKLESVNEKRRDSIEDIVLANIKRTQESLRVLEEIFKLIDEESSLKFKALRYNSYILEKNTIESIKNTL